MNQTGLETKINFTGKNKLTDEEFVEYYEQLWDKTPHRGINWPTKEQLAESKRISLNRYNFSEDTYANDEKWVNGSTFGWNDYEISNYGRIKYKGSIVLQDDNELDGYLKLSKSNKEVDHNINVYELIGRAFLGKRTNDDYDIHHINDDGYNNTPENLILLTRKQHNLIHCNIKIKKENVIKELKKYNYCTLILHLSNYKASVLNTPEQMNYRGKKYRHILPEEKRMLNLIDSGYKDSLEKYITESKIKLHRDFSHLNSSQALCLNLFYPLMKDHSLQFVNNNISLSAIGEFEHTEEASFEVSGEYTNFDFFINDSNTKYFFEIKYTESNFGSIDTGNPIEAYQTKYKNNYLSQLKKICNEKYLNDDFEDEFYKKYQLWRNICHVDIGTITFVFLKSRINLKNEIDSAMKKCKPEYAAKINIIYIEDFISRCLENKNLPFYNHYSEFYNKYLKNI